MRDVFGFRQSGTGYARGHVSRHLADGNIDLALMVYDSEDVEEARLSVRASTIGASKSRIATAMSRISEPGEGALKFRAPDGTVAEIVGASRYKTKGEPV
jgi:lactoylglutathione lyase